MKYTTAALCLVSATLSLAAPTGTSTVSARGGQAWAGFALPSIIKNHDIKISKEELEELKGDEATYKAIGRA